VLASTASKRSSAEFVLVVDALGSTDVQRRCEERVLTACFEELGSDSALLDYWLYPLAA